MNHVLTNDDFRIKFSEAAVTLVSRNIKPLDEETFVLGKTEV